MSIVAIIIRRAGTLRVVDLTVISNSPVVHIAVTPPQIVGPSENDFEVTSWRVHCRIATLDFRHVVIRYRHVKRRSARPGA